MEEITDEITDGTALADERDTEERLRAVLARHRRTGDTAELRLSYEDLGRPRVEVPGLAEDVRAAVVHAYAPRRAAATSDPRWQVEALCTEPPAPVDAVELRGRAMIALATAGRTPQRPMPCDLYPDEVDGHFDVILYTGGLRNHRRPGELFLSPLGPFVGGSDQDRHVRRAFAAAGFHWIDEPTGAIRLPGLDLHHRDRRKVLCVEDLLLVHWHDR
ncbi:hypothetical protein [Kitasatospora sp. NPDC008115]|uniref:hypothetical protein n=1 Tax=Kitasatospora sp. NPDC008115 TaxID=3364022 RepID=UPI0036F09F9F